ncbi:MAG: hypothetical protein ACRENN_02355 [Candidatus Eiseniibacteriota bacterium]
MNAARGFRWAEYAPFGWILGAQAVFLILAVRLDTALSMATVGALAGGLLGDAPLHYPDFFLHLPTLATLVDAFLYTIPGSILIPLSLIRMQRHLEPEVLGNMATKPWLRRAVPPTLFAWLVQAALFAAWDALVEAFSSHRLIAAMPGESGFITAWTLNVLGAYAISAIFLYVPIVAVRDEGTFSQTIRDGLVEGLSVFRHTWLFIVVLSLPALPFLLLAELQAAVIVNRLQPELVALLLAIYAAVVSVASYLIFGTARRFHSPVDEWE